MFSKGQPWFKQPPQFSEQPIHYPKPKHLSAWLENLPLANLDRSVELVHNLLCHYHQCSLQADVRYQSLEQIRPITQYLCQSIQDYYTNAVKVSRRKRRSVLHLVQAIHMEMANSYALLAIKQQLDSEQIAYCVHRAMTHLTYILMHNYQLYCIPPKYIWHKLYQLFKFASQQQLLSSHITDECGGITFRTAIRGAFIIPLLLASSNPYQLHFQDINQIYKFLLVWAAQAKISSKITEQDLFVFNIHSDEPPSYRELIKQPLTTPAWFGLDCTNLVTNLISLCEHDCYQENLDSHLAAHLQRAWSSLPNRAFPRTCSSGQLTTNVGLAATHYFINNKKDVIPAHLQPDEAIQFSLHSDPNPGEVGNHSPVSSQYGKNLLHYRQHRWQLVNASANGYCLCTTADYPEDIQVGEMISIKEANINDNTNWHIGIIKWIKYTDDDQLQVGIQLIAPQAIAVGVRGVKQALLNSAYLRALLLSDYNSDNTCPTIIVPKLHYQTGNTVHLLNEIIDLKVKLGKCLYEGTGYKHFTYTLIEDDDVNAVLPTYHNPLRH